MPDSVFNSLIHLQDKKEFIQVYFKLTPSQKDFLDMEKGFVLPRSNPKQTKERANLINEVRNLYYNLTDEQYSKIGFGFPISNFKSTFSNYFNNLKMESLFINVSIEIIAL